MQFLADRYWCRGDELAIIFIFIFIIIFVFYLFNFINLTEGLFTFIMIILYFFVHFNVILHAALLRSNCLPGNVQLIFIFLRCKNK